MYDLAVVVEKPDETQTAIRQESTGGKIPIQGFIDNPVWQPRKAFVRGFSSVV